MKRLLLWLFLFVVGTSLQMGLTYFPVPFLRWDIVLLLVLYLGFRFSFLPTAFCVLLMGLAVESLSVSHRGVLSLSYLAIFSLQRAVAGSLFLEAGLGRMVFVGILVLLEKIIVSLLIGEGGGIGSPIPMVLNALLQAALSPFFFEWLDRMEKRLAEEF